MTGRPSNYRGKNRRRSFTLTMTDVGHDAAERGALATGVSKNDYIERVLRTADKAITRIVDAKTPK